MENRLSLAAMRAIILELTVVVKRWDEATTVRGVESCAVRPEVNAV